MGMPVYTREHVNSFFYSDIQKIRESFSSKLDTESVNQICSYLENPTKKGIIVLKAKYKKLLGITGDIISDLKKELKGKNEFEIQFGKTKRVIRIGDKEKEELIDYGWRITSLFSLFTYLYHSENKILETIVYYLESESSKDIMIISLIDTEKLKQKYSEAYAYFKDNIYFDGFSPIVWPKEITKIKEGCFILDDSLFKGDESRIISLDIKTIEKLEKFLNLLGKIDNVTKMPIFSPEDEVFEPYFPFLQEAYNYLIDNNNIKRLFKKAIKEYSDDTIDEPFTYSIRTIGLIAEDYLTQIYETIFRDICPKGLTLGQLYELMNNMINQKFRKEAITVPEIGLLYTEINTLLERQNPPDSNLSGEILKFLRKILNYIKEDKKHTCELIKETERKKVNLSIFPKRLQENINELIKYRNAVSHKSREPMGNYEAQRTVYCCINLIIWWNNEKKIIDWTNQPEGIMKSMIERNSNITLEM